MKRLRLLIAKWALAPKSITPEDLMQSCGIDIDAIINTKLESMQGEVKQLMSKATDKLKESETHAAQVAQEQVKKLIGDSFADLAPEVLTAAILANKALSELQKSQLVAILTAPKRDITYLQ